MALMVGMYHTRELYNAEVKEILEDNSSNDWFDKIIISDIFIIGSIKDIHIV